MANNSTPIDANNDNNNNINSNNTDMPFIKSERLENRTDLMERLWPYEHKCERLSCVQMSHQLSTMRDMIAVLSQLNDHYLTQINCCQSICDTALSAQRLELNELMAKYDDVINVNLERLKTIAAEPKPRVNSRTGGSKSLSSISLRAREPKRYVPFESEDEEFTGLARAKQPSIQVNQNNKTEKKICDLCGKRFWPSVLKLHISKQHPNDAGVDRADTFADNSNSTSCPFCAQQFTNKTDLETHVNVVHSQSLPIGDNNDGNKDGDDYDGDMFDDNNDIDYDSEDFEDNEELGEDSEHTSNAKVATRRSTRKRNNASQKQTTGSKCKCNICGRVLSTPSSLQVHMRTHTGVRPYVCDWPQCEKSFSLRPQLEAHIGKCHPTEKHLKCNFPNCDFETNSKYWLRRHRSRKHNLKMDIKTGAEINKDDMACSWPGCEKRYPIQSLLNEHYKTHTGERQYVCNWPGCERKYRYKYRLTVHMRVHTGERPMVCSWPGCEKSFRNNACLISHRLTHDKSLKRRHACEWPGCDKSFDSLQLHEQHIYAAHTKERPFKCDWPACGAEFSSKRNMERHHEMIHKLSEKKFKCSRAECERAYIDQASLDKHIERMHECTSFVKNKRTRKLEPRYKCDWPGCEYQALFPRALQIHRMRHTGERPIKCQWPNCHFSTVRKFQLDSHMLKHTGETPFPCEWPSCGRRFKSQRALDYHTEKTHNVVLDDPHTNTNTNTNTNTTFTVEFTPEESAQSVDYADVEVNRAANVDYNVVQPIASYPPPQAI